MNVLIFYLIGVLAMLLLIIVANWGSDPKEWKAKYIFRSFLWALGSWVCVTILAYHGLR